MKRTIVIIVALLVILGLGAFALNKSNDNTSTSQPSSSSSSSNTSSNQPAAQTGQVKIDNMMFTPSQITVAKGGTVTWTNNDSTTHTVVDDLSNVGGPASGDIPPGGTYSFTFTKSGSFQYHCTIHPSMRGTIVVK